jgi:uncharacterized protein
MATAAEIIFPASARRMQERYASRAAYAKRDQPDGFKRAVDEELTAFLAEVDSFFIATATHEAQPYIQHRGGPKGFLKVLGPTTLGFADFIGNRQYITVGRLTENPAVCLFLIDYAQRTRVKVWGRGRIVEDDPQLLTKLTEPGYKARVERAILIDIDAWDINCRQHIPQKFAAADVEAAVSKLQGRIGALESESAALRKRLLAARESGEGAAIEPGSSGRP